MDAKPIGKVEDVQLKVMNGEDCVTEINVGDVTTYLFTGECELSDVRPGSGEPIVIDLSNK